MADFAKYASKLLQLESDYCWHPENQGGPICKGVRLKTYQQHYGKDKTKEDLRDISYGEWCSVVKASYWDVIKGDMIENQSLAEIIADWAVVDGLLGVRKVQEIVGCISDGIVGPITLSMINTSNAEFLHERIWKARQQSYINIVKRNPLQKILMNRWMSRLNQLMFE